jgi:signal peptidase
MTALTVVVAGVALFVLLPSLLGFERYVIESGSMEPTLPVGTLVYAKAEAPEYLAVGDIITYEPPPETKVDDLVTHRIVEIEPETLNAPRPDAGAQDTAPRPAEPRLLFRTKGDANEKPDPWTFALEPEGAALEKAHVPYIGYVYLALAIPWVRLVAIVIPALLIVVLTAVSLWRAAGREAEEERERIERETLERDRAGADEKEPV